MTRTQWQIIWTIVWVTPWALLAFWTYVLRNVEKMEEKQSESTT